MSEIAIADLDPIIVTASRGEEEVATTPASVTLIDAARTDRLGAPLVTDVLRLVPSAAVSRSGPAGSLTDVRIRGAEASHSLLFIDGIRANDPAAGNIPRFELLNADLAGRVEVVRGPQSALWGSEAIGGVIAVTGAAPGSGGTLGLVEGGSFGTRRGAARTSLGTEERGLSLGLAAQRSAGIDSFSGDGDRDGYRNLAGRISGAYRLSPTLIVGGSGFALSGRNEFDGYDPDPPYDRADTLDRSRNRLAAGRLAATLGDRDESYATASASLLGSVNRNFLDADLVNRTSATRRALAIEAGHSVGRHAFIAALEAERETFAARDTAGGFTNQDRSRRHRSATVEWKMRDLGPLSTGLSLRHDNFSAFKDATTLRAAILAKFGNRVSIATTYGQGIAQPTFFDLFGYFPGSFVGNPSLRPEKSRGGEISLRYRHNRMGAALTYYRQRLRHEIVDVFTFPSTTVNAEGTSRRQGLEAEANWSHSDALRLTAHYAWLDASEPTAPDGGRLKEQRRPRHSGSIALDGASGRLSYGTMLAYTGGRVDTEFAGFTARRLTLSPYWLASAQLAYRVAGPLQAHVRIANAFDEDYQDVVGYRTEGRSIHAGVRVAFGR